MENNVNNQNVLFRKNFFNRFNAKVQQNKNSASQYNDSPPLDENVLKEMASAYSSVLSKYGYTVQPENKPNSNAFSNQNNFENQTPIIENNASPEPATANVASQQPPFFDNNFGFLPSPTFPDTFTQLQTTNNLLTQILNELKVISCMIECNRRRRLS